MLISRSIPFLLSLSLCTSIFCADTPSDKTKLAALMSATYEDFANMDTLQTQEAQELLEQHIDATKQGFLNELLFFGVSRRTLSRSVDYLAGSLLTAGFLFDSVEIQSHNYNLEQEIRCGIREADTCSINEHGIFPTATVISGACGYLLLQLSAQFSTHPAERQLQTIKSVEYAKIKAAIHATMNRRR